MHFVFSFSNEDNKFTLSFNFYILIKRKKLIKKLRNKRQKFERRIYILSATSQRINTTIFILPSNEIVSIDLGNGWVTIQETCEVSFDDYNKIDAQIEAFKWTSEYKFYELLLVFDSNWIILYLNSS